jgi:sugar phosphate isomerase/epimerase
MSRTLSTYLFVQRKLNSAVIESAARAGFDAIELFCEAGHFDYRSAADAHELAGWLEAHQVALHSVHAPVHRDLAPSREGGSPLSISEPERVRRAEAVDEIKRALDLAEQVPYQILVQHVGGSREPDDPRHWDAAFNSLEHLALFAKERGVTIALENTPGELATPANLRRFVDQTRLTDLRFCFDAGHAHIGDGIAASLEPMRPLIVTTHLHDNHGDKDEHLVPYQGTVDWPAAIKGLPAGAHLVMELRAPAASGPAAAKGESRAGGGAESTDAAVLDAARDAFKRLEKELPARA